VGRLGDEGPADEIFETLLRHRSGSISRFIALSMQSEMFERTIRAPETNTDVCALLG
jgi:hypothetical protein